ncbi:MAG: non-canonical purine NTP diphosphatase [Flavobacteriales bacterium]|nr:non-canonical purine NTP diphosphatase [Flavobacteriales bacterium]
MKLVFATHNSNKAKEIQSLLPDDFQILTLTDINCLDEIPETAETLEGNSLLKAQFINDHFNLNCFADDTGLEIDALNGRPGVYSARYAGEEKSAEANMNLVLSELQNESNRKAQFRTVITLILNDKTYIFEGIVKGKMSTEKRGTEGFGYDPIFIPEGQEKTFAEMTLAEKNQQSHRARAFEKMIEFLKKV